MKIRSLFALSALSLASICSSMAHATVVNISTSLNGNPVVFADPTPGITDVGTTLQLAAGTYRVAAVDTSFAGAQYTAALRFSGVSVPTVGYEWNHFISINGAAGVKHGYGEGAPSQDGDYQATAALAFAHAPAAYQFTLSNPSAVTFYWRDSEFGDNSGGISLNVTAVPEPESYALMLAGLGMLGFLARRKQAKKLG
jgi:hypothetical protein